MNTSSLKAPTSRGILSLPDEILTLIILYLTSREAIYLSITSRHFFHGILSQYNSFLWYRLLCGPCPCGPYPRIGVTMPGQWRPEWAFPNNSMLPMASSGPWGTLTTVPWPSPLRDPPLLLVPTVRARSFTPPRPGPGPQQPTMEEPRAKFENTTGMKVKDFKDCVMNFRTMEPHRRFEGGAIQYIPNYRRLLLDSMLGDTEDGCQWCLKWDRWQESHMVPELNMRLCTWCFASNLIGELVLLIAKLPVMNSWFDFLNGSSQWRFSSSTLPEEHPYRYLPPDLHFLL